MNATNLLHVLQHALGRDEHGRPRKGSDDYRNHFCAGEGSADFGTCREAVGLGLMVEHPPCSVSGGDSVFVVTEAGKTYIVEHSPAPPKLTRSQSRYRAWLRSAEAECGVTFGEWLRTVR